MNLSDYIISLIRTVVPVAIGSVASWLLVKHAIHIDPSVQTSVTALLTAVVTSLYYAGVRFLESKFPKGPWGYFLGHTARPVYLSKKMNTEKVHPGIGQVGGKS